jgi:hypothetical protein
MTFAITLNKGQSLHGGCLFFLLHERRLSPMAYTPELSCENNCNLRRLAWFLGRPMTETLETVIELLSVRMAEINPGEVYVLCYRVY